MFKNIQIKYGDFSIDKNIVENIINDYNNNGAFRDSNLDQETIEKIID